MVKSDKDCIFCKIVRKEIKSDLIAESNSFVSILDKDQSIKGHALVIPKQHLVTLLDIPNKFGAEMLDFTKKIASDLMDKRYGDGFNLIMNNLSVAGQQVMHAHLHVIPRKDSDGLRFLTRV